MVKTGMTVCRLNSKAFGSRSTSLPRRTMLLTRWVCWTCSILTNVFRFRTL